MTTPAGDECTVVKTTHGPRAAASARLPGEFADALPTGTRLHEFEILSVVGQGGFGIVYLAHDHALDRRVAIKEYMPSALATRTQAMTVAVRSSRHTETFAAGLRSFVNEARLLAQFDHPSLLKVHRFWEAHGTAYMVMPYYAGITFAQQLAQPGGPPDEAQLRALLNPLLDALALLHTARCYHRDIAPDNILLLPNGTPLLLDFGAARRVIGDMTQALTVILKTGYAPVEQYGAMPDLSQGAWTDLYALGSVVEFAITGRTPPQAVARFLADKREPLAVRAAGRYSDGFLQAIDRALAVLPKDRPQNVAEMRALLAVGLAPSRSLSNSPRGARVDHAEMTVPRVDPALPPGPTATNATNTGARTRRRGVAFAWAAVLIVVIAAVAGGRMWLVTATAPVAQPPASPPPAAVMVKETPAASPSPSPPPAASAAPVDIEPTPTSALPSVPEVVPEAVPEVAARKPGSTQPKARVVAPPAAREQAQAPPTSQRIPNKKLPSARCADIIQRVSLGEPLNDAEKAILQRECGP